MRRKVAAVTAVLVFLAASCLIADGPVSEATPLENTWTTRAPMHQARGGLGVVAVNNKIYAVGGAVLSGLYPPDILGGFVGTNEEYNTATDTWASKSSMPTPRDHFAIAAYENKIYCIGGAVGVRVDERTHFSYYVESGINEVYDIASDQWQTMAPMPKSSMRIQASVINGKIWVTGVGLTYVYDPLADSWTNRTAMPFSPPPSVASLPLQTAIGTKIFVTGEFSTGAITSEQKLLIYDARTDTWSQGTHGPLIVANGGVGATSGTASLIRIYVLGLVKYPPEPANQVYDPKTNIWIAATPMPTLRMDFGVAVIDDILYAVGGYFISEPLLSRVVPTNVNEQYTTIGYGTPDPYYDETAPIITLLSPENKTYHKPGIPLNFTVNEPDCWLSYKLDDGDVTNILGNITLSGFYYGSHNVTVYATDEMDNTRVESIVFTLSEPEKPIDNSSTLPIMPISASVAAVVVIAIAGLLVYRRKRQGEAGQP